MAAGNLAENWTLDRDVLTDIKVRTRNSPKSAKMGVVVMVAVAKTQGVQISDGKHWQS